ncbi:hypothetical protein D3C85_871480 [compost metagenome]
MLTEDSATNNTSVKLDTLKFGELVVMNVGGMGETSTPITYKPYNSKASRTLPGSTESAELELQLVYLPGGLEHKALTKLKADGKKGRFVIDLWQDATKKVGTAMSFDAYVLGWTVDNATDNVRLINWSLKVDGEITEAASAVTP